MGACVYYTIELILYNRYRSRAEAELGAGEARLKEVVFISMFAGYGGTGILCRYTVKHIQTDPETYVCDSYM